jgi:hypothetical protein
METKMRMRGLGRCLAVLELEAPVTSTWIQSLFDEHSCAVPIFNTVTNSLSELVIE